MEQSPEQPWHVQRQFGKEPVTWDAAEKEYVVTLMGFSGGPSEDQDDGLTIKYKPPVLFDARICRVGESFGPGFLSPSNSPTFIGLMPGQRYDLQVQPVDPATGNPIPGSDSTRRRILVTDDGKVVEED